MRFFSCGQITALMAVLPVSATQRAGRAHRLLLLSTVLAACLILPASRVTAQSRSNGASPTLTTLYDFSALDSNGENSDGGCPFADLTRGNDGSFYGTTSEGGSAGEGTVFKITPTGTLTTLYAFSALAGGFGGVNSDGASPVAGLVLGSDGSFYGTTSEGGNAGLGTVFKITSSGTLTTLVDFNGTNGGGSSGSLIQGSDGDFYGTCQGGGTSRQGEVFKTTPSGALSVLFSFSSQTTDGAYPATSLIQDSSGNFYGTTSGGGLYGYGTAFRITPSGTLTTLAQFDGTSGAFPNGTLVEGDDGALYGTTFYANTTFDGTVFKIPPGGSAAPLHTFSATVSGKNGDGAHPYAALTLGSDGNFYGTTSAGGNFAAGTAFQITPSGTLTTLIDFTGANGSFPRSNLLPDGDGSFYGTTEYGGSGGEGTVFKLTIPSLMSGATLTSLSPGTLQAGNLPFVLTVTGTSFSHGVTLNFNGTTLTPAFAASTKLTFNVPAALVAAPSTFSVTVSDPGAAPSNTLPFTVTPGLTLTHVSPASAPAGSAATSITVTGANFVNGAVVKWNGQPLLTYYLSPTQATATVPASLLATAGTANITISNPHVYATAPLTFTVTAH